MSLLHVSTGPKAPEIVNIVIEIPRGSTNKYEVDAKTGVIMLDRVLYSPLFYPFDYGYIPQTHYLDGDPLDALVLITHPTFPGCVVEARPIAVLAMRDDKGPDEKILCVATKDPRYNSWSNLADLNEHIQKEVIHFFEVYKTLEEKEVDVLGWLDVEAAVRLVDKYRIQPEA